MPVNAIESLDVSGVSNSDLDLILTAMVSLSVVRWSRDIPVDSFVDDVAEAISVFDRAGDSQESKERLRRILLIESLLITSKAITIFTDYQRTLHGAKILTDLRYVFKDDPDTEPYGAVVAHLFKLTYHEDTEHKEFFVAMDDGDLEDLKDIIERAQAKARTIRRKLDEQKTAYLGNATDIEEDRE
jgi:hypothetical protein